MSGPALKSQLVCSFEQVLLLRICYLHAVSRHRGSKNEFSNAQEYASHLIAFNAPIAALIVDLSTVWTAFMVWAGLSLLAVVWISLVARRSIDFVTKLDRLAAEGATTEEAQELMDKEALKLFDIIDANKDGVLSKEEILRYLADQDVRLEGHPGSGGAGKAAAPLVRDVLRLADRDGNGLIGRREWTRAFAAVRELLRDEEGDGQDSDEEKAS
mmetsp:Transcript_86403/g.230818  ORF Transcript_86403/g.230818 Transcript_86403/m.230818 type:complete len:214 (+) Transcript_86403:320-961(+)